MMMMIIETSPMKSVFLWYSSSSTSSNNNNNIITTTMIIITMMVMMMMMIIETSTMNSVFLWYRSQRDVHLFCKSRMMFTWTNNVGNSSYHGRDFLVFFDFDFDFFCFFFAFPSYISGVHHFWVRFLRMWLFFNPTIKVVTFRLRRWCVLGVFLLPAFTRLGHERQDLLSPCDEMHVCTD